MSFVARDDLADLLRAPGGRKGSFATRRSAPATDLAIEVEGVGRLAVPVLAAQAKRLRSIAHPAEYGLGEETILDKRVRDTWEIPRSRVRIDQHRWNQTLGPILRTVRDDLGLPAGSILDAELHSVLLYETGQFFAAHQDSEKTDEMVATLVVMLPSRSTGGELAVEHRGEKVSYAGSASSLTFVAFYADTRHEVLPVLSGHRVVLTYNLSLTGVTATHQGTPTTISTAAELLRRHFTETPPPRWRGDRNAEAPADRLVVLLDHHYTERGLRWTHLKGDDAARVEVLRAAAEQANCEVALAHAEIQETRNAYDDNPRRSQRGWSARDDADDSDDFDDDFDDDSDSDGSDGAVAELLDSSVTLTAAAGEAHLLTGDVEPNELAQVTPSLQLKPYDTEYTGFMGNWGNTMDRWYRRAAIVVWPRTRAFALRAKADPVGALVEILGLDADDEQARTQRADHVVTLLRFWPEAVRGLDQARVMPAALRLANELGDADLAAQLLDPFVVEALAPADAPLLSALVGRYHASWVEARVRTWLAVPRYSAGEAMVPRREWVSQLAELCAGLVAGDVPSDRADGGHGRWLADVLVQQLGLWIISELNRMVATPVPSQRDSALVSLAAPTLAVLQATTVADPPSTRDRLVDCMRNQLPHSLPLLVGLLRESAELSPSAQTAIAIPALARWSAVTLAAELAQPERQPDDWSIVDFVGAGHCSDCSALAAFLADPTAQRLSWPLAKPRRQHIHRRIEEAELPVTHTTVHTGSPHQLILTKTAALHRLAAEHRRVAEASLALAQQVLADH